MTITESHLNKKLENLTFEDIEAYFVNRQDETDTIEFKSFVAAGTLDQKLGGVYKSCSAFLNSLGGVLIWGAPIGVNDPQTNEKYFQGALTPINQVLGKDWLINKITGNVKPVPYGIRVNILEDNGTCVCVFEIESGKFSPHQYNDTYYMRLDGQSRPAPHHYIEALFKRINFPQIEGFIKVVDFGFSSSIQRYMLDLHVYIFNFSELQNEYNISYRLVTTKGRFAKYGIPEFANRYPADMEGFEFRVPNAKDILYYGEPLYEPERILFSTADFPDNNRDITLILTFGGKKSPLKTSKYVIRVVDLNPANSGILLREIKENQLSHEIHEELGTTRESILLRILEREA